MKRLLAGALALILSVGASGTTLNPVQLLNPSGSAAGQTIVSTSSSTAPGWGTIPLSGLSAIPANTVVANGTGASTTPVAFSMPSCSTAGNALEWSSGTGFICASGFAPLASPAFTGTPTAPTAALGTSTTQLATTAFDRAQYAAPPAIGNTTPAAGTFTTLAGNSLSKVFATKATAQTLASASQTTVTTWVTTYDVNSNFNASTGTFTAPATGDYWISSTVVTVQGALAASSQFDCVLLVNGAQTAIGPTYYPAAGTSNASCTVTAFQHLTAAQTVNIAIFNGTGVSLTTINPAASTSISISQTP